MLKCSEKKINLCKKNKIKKYCNPLTGECDKTPLAPEEEIEKSKTKQENDMPIIINLIIIDLDKKWQYLITIGHLLNQNQMVHFLKMRMIGHG